MDPSKPWRDGRDREDDQTNLTDAEWERVQPFIPPVAKRGRKPTADMQKMLNVIHCMVRNGDGWHMLPTSFGPGWTVLLVVPVLRAPPDVLHHHDIALMIDR